MLEGLEVSEIMLSKTIENKDFRTDSDFWTREPKLNPNLRYEKIGNCLVSAQYGISIEMNQDNIGYPIYRMNEIYNMLCDFEVDKFADISLEELETFKLNEGDVLFNRTNSYQWVGRTGIYKKIDERDFVFASYLVRFAPDKNKVLPEYLTTFLNSKFGVWDVKRRARQSINQTNVNPEEVKQIDIPLLSISFQEKIKSNFDFACVKLLESTSLYSQAENLLLEAVGLTNFEPSKEPVNIKGFKESFGSTGRLDAEYYQKKYEQVVARIKSQKHNTLTNLVAISKSIEPGSAHYSDEEGLPFYRVSDYNKLGLSEPDKRLTNAFVKDNQELIAKLKPKEGTILFSKDGSVGTAYLLRDDLKGITSGAILQLQVRNEKEVLPEYLTLALNSKLVQMQAERDAGGSIILHWRKEEIEQVVVPIIDYEIQQQIAQLVEESFRLKAESERLLALAKQIVETAIEEGEEKAMELMRLSQK